MLSKFAFALACLAVAGQGRRVQKPLEQELGTASDAFASLILGLSPSTGFQGGAPLTPGRSSRTAEPEMAKQSRAKKKPGPAALIIQNKGGGHGEIGYHLALEMKNEKGMDVTIMHEGPLDKSKMPHSKYGDLEEAGINVEVFEDLASMEAKNFTFQLFSTKQVDAVVDNWSKSCDKARNFVNYASKYKVQNYAYVSSAGLYTPEEGDYSGMVETTPINEECDQGHLEKMLRTGMVRFSIYRPQYIYGPNQGKSYLKYFFDRLTAGRPVPVPGDGTQQVTFTHAEDIAKMISAGIGNVNAKRKILNLATDVLLTYDEIVKMCAEAAGVSDAKIVHYNPKGFDIPKGFFPFRDTPFYVNTDEAKLRLKHEVEHALADDISWYFKDNYKAGGSTDFTLDDEIIAKSPEPVSAGAEVATEEATA